MRPMLLLFACLILAACQAAEPSPAKPREITIAVAGDMVTGTPKLPIGETELTLITAGGNNVTIQWSQLDPTERKRVQRLLGASTEARSNVGREVEAVRMVLASGRTVEGLRIPERDRKGSLALQTREMKVMMVPEADIKSKEAIKGHEGDYFTPQEIFDRLLTETTVKNDDAAMHMELAAKAEELGLLETAIKYLDAAALIDPRTKDRNKDHRAQLAIKTADKAAQDLYDGMLRDMRGGDNMAALLKLNRLDRNFPNSELRSRWADLRPKLEASRKEDQNKAVIQLFYGVADELLQKKLAQKIRLDEKGNIVPSLPGKQVTTKTGDVFRGTLEDETGESLDNQGDKQLGDIKIKTSSATIKISKKDIISTQDVDLSVAAREVDPVYEDLKTYITDLGSPAGLKGQAAAKIALMLDIKAEKVKEIFDTRLNRDATYVDGKMQRSAVYTTIHTANYDKGSWLRDGSKFLPSPGPKTNTLTRYRNVRDQNGTNHAVREEVKETREKDEVEQSDEPNEWFSVQTVEVRLATLRGVMAEKVFKAKTIENVACKTCGGKGEISITSTLGGVETSRCPTCRGLKALFRVLYE